MKTKQKKKKIRLTGVIFILLIIYLISMVVYYLFSVPNKTIIVNGNDLLTENEVIKASKIDENTSIFRVLTSGVCRKIKKLDLVNDCNLKVGINGSVKIIIKENKILFLDNLKKELVLSNKARIKNYQDYIGYPILVNYTPSEVLEKLIDGLNKIDEDTISMISEIEYSPDRYNDVIIDEERFLLRMNDGNEVYINTVNIKKLNKYQSIYATIGDKGILYLDSNSETYIFKKFGEVNEG